MSLAARGLRDLDGGAEEITDQVERAALRAQARRVHAESLALSVVVTALSLLAP